MWLGLPKNVIKKILLTIVYIWFVGIYLIFPPFMLTAVTGAVTAYRTHHKVPTKQKSWLIHLAAAVIAALLFEVVLILIGGISSASWAQQLSFNLLRIAAITAGGFGIAFLTDGFVKYLLKDQIVGQNRVGRIYKIAGGVMVFTLIVAVGIALLLLLQG